MEIPRVAPRDGSYLALNLRAPISNSNCLLRGMCHCWPAHVPRATEPVNEGETAGPSVYCSETAQPPWRTGSVNVNVDPLPISLATQMRPPCNSTNFRHSARPSPVPSAFFSDFPTWRNSSNTAS